MRRVYIYTAHHASASLWATNSSVQIIKQELIVLGGYCFGEFVVLGGYLHLSFDIYIYIYIMSNIIFLFCILREFWVSETG